MPFPAENLAHFLAIGAALAFALSNHLQSAGLAGADTRSALLVNIATGAAFYWLLSPLFLEWSYFETRAAMLFALVGIIRPPLSMAFSMLAIRSMGPTIASAFASTAPMFAAAFAIVLLGEEMTPRIAAGTALIVLGAVMATLRSGNIRRDWPLWAIGLPLTTAAIRAAAHGVTKLGLENLPNAMFASLIGYSVGVLVMAAIFGLQRHRFSGGFQSHKWFVAAGLASSVGIFCLNNALKLGTVLTVAPIVSCAPVFTLVLSLIVFRKERITWRIAAAIALVVPGVVLLILR